MYFGGEEAGSKEVLAEMKGLWEMGGGGVVPPAWVQAPPLWVF